MGVLRVLATIPVAERSGNSHGIPEFSGECTAFLRLTVGGKKMEDLMMRPVKGRVGEYLIVLKLVA